MPSIKPVKLDFKIVKPSVQKNKNDMILIHGTSASKASFEDIVYDLANETGRKIYTIDVRNHGNSEHSDVFNFEALTVDLINFMNEQNIKMASILGHSMGGRLAMITAFNHADRVESIVIEDMTPKALPREIVTFLDVYLRLMQESIDQIPLDANIEEARNSIHKYVFAALPKGVLDELKTVNEDLYPLNVEKKDGKYVWKTNLSVMRKELENMKYTENLSGLSSTPALFLYGTQSDLKVGDGKDFILKLFPKAEFQALPTSHIVHSEALPEFLKAVKEFLE